MKNLFTILTLASILSLSSFAQDAVETPTGGDHCSDERKTTKDTASTTKEETTEGTESNINN